MERLAYLKLMENTEIQPVQVHRLLEKAARPAAMAPVLRLAGRKAK
jgi:hypothetical protein